MRVKVIAEQMEASTLIRGRKLNAWHNFDAQRRACGERFIPTLLLYHGQSRPPHPGQWLALEQLTRGAPTSHRRRWCGRVNQRA